VDQVNWKTKKKMIMDEVTDPVLAMWEKIKISVTIPM
jgi:hypothetical protein